MSMSTPCTFIISACSVNYTLFGPLWTSLSLLLLKAFVSRLRSSCRWMSSDISSLFLSPPALRGVSTGTSSGLNTGICHRVFYQPCTVSFRGHCTGSLETIILNRHKYIFPKGVWTKKG